jgi:hypothetical protein
VAAIDAVDGLVALGQALGADLAGAALGQLRGGKKGGGKVRRKMGESGESGRSEKGDVGLVGGRWGPPAALQVGWVAAVAGQGGQVLTGAIWYGMCIGYPSCSLQNMQM